ncbi:hypothetical protein [Aeromonas salmonicida]|uniref:hypothetical protein n=1 Tax=Aeromonas salmonicida TaxID=645 RepID=UPI003F7BE1B5
MKHQNDHIKFPSGNTVEFCRKKAKKLVKEKGIKLAQALDIIAELNGISGGWHNAMRQLNNKLQTSAVMSPKLPKKLERLFEKIDAAIPKLPANIEQLIAGAAIPKLPANIEQLIAGAAIPKLPANVEQLIAGAAIPKLPANVEQLIAGAAISKLPDSLEQMLKTVDAFIPRELRDYQKTLKHFEDVVNKPLSDLGG